MRYPPYTYAEWAKYEVKRTAGEHPQARSVRIKLSPELVAHIGARLPDFVADIEQEAESVGLTVEWPEEPTPPECSISVFPVL